MKTKKSAVADIKITNEDVALIHRALILYSQWTENKNNPRYIMEYNKLNKLREKFKKYYFDIYEKNIKDNKC